MAFLVTQVLLPKRLTFCPHANYDFYDSILSELRSVSLKAVLYKYLNKITIVHLEIPKYHSLPLSSCHR